MQFPILKTPELIILTDMNVGGHLPAHHEYHLTWWRFPVAKRTYLIACAILAIGSVQTSTALRQNKLFEPR
jgi:hypothetical protein